MWVWNTVDYGVLLNIIPHKGVSTYVEIIGLFFTIPMHVFILVKIGRGHFFYWIRMYSALFILFGMCFSQGGGAFLTSSGDEENWIVSV